MERNISPRDPSSKLLDAKRDFQRLLLENDASFAVIQEKLLDSNANDAELPSFSIEPTLKRDESSQSTLGFCITKAREVSHDELGAKVSNYEYIQLGVMDRNVGTFAASDELKDLLASAGLQKEDTLSIVRAWQEGTGKLIEAMDGELGLHPFSHTFELQSELERTAHPIDD